MLVCRGRIVVQIEAMVVDMGARDEGVLGVGCIGVEYGRG